MLHYFISFLHIAKIPCSQPPEIDHGSIKLPRSQERRNKAKSRSYKHGTTLSYVCDDGFRLAEDHGVTCHMGKWSAPPRCVGENSMKIQFWFQNKSLPKIFLMNNRRMHDLDLYIDLCFIYKP